MEQVIIKSEPTQAPEGHDEKMIALAESKMESTESTTDRPSWLPEKFKSAEDMAKAYAELESKMGSGSKESTEAPQTQTPATEQGSTEKQAQEALADKQLDLSEFSKEFAEKGSLSAESYDKLSKAGFSKELVDQYIEGRTAVSAKYEAEVMDEVGGQSRYKEMVEWAKVNMSDAEIEAFNAEVSSGNKDKAKLAVLGLGKRFTQEVGEAPKLYSGRTSASSSDVFKSNAQVTAAMRDPRYKTDPAYRAEVADKIARSSGVL